MESRNRTVWIVVSAVLVVACCCVLAAAAGAVGWFANRYAEIGPEPFDLGGLNRDRLEQSFEAGDAPTLEIDNFAGQITVRPSEDGTVRVVATKKASGQSRLDRIEVSMAERDGRVVVKTRNPNRLQNVSVDLEIAAPVDSRVNLAAGAGTVNVRDIAGPIDVQSGAGTVNVRGAQGSARVALGAGQIVYEGAPSGDCRFDTGAGEIILRLPEDPDVRLDLSTGLGAVSVDFSVDGRVSVRSVEGTIGDGSRGTISASTGVGAISVKRR
jgi:DUF4097 and DUF4098 domain-containing protein YvlB